MIGERRNGTRSGTWSAAFGGALYGSLCASPALAAALVRGALPAGPHEIAWDRRGDGGDRVPGGVYFVRLESDGRRIVRRISVVP